MIEFSRQQVHLHTQLQHKSMQHHTRIIIQLKTETYRSTLTEEVQQKNKNRTKK